MLGFYILLYLAYSPSEPECRIDQDCPRQQSCIGETCQNLCSIRNPCFGDLECSIEESQHGKRTVACPCPPGLVFKGNGASFYRSKH